MGPLCPKYSARFEMRKNSGSSDHSQSRTFSSRDAAKTIAAIEPAVVKTKCPHPE
jgi:hypothetical protein